MKPKLLVHYITDCVDNLYPDSSIEKTVEWYTSYILDTKTDVPVPTGQEVLILAFRAAIATGKLKAERVEFKVNGVVYLHDDKGRFIHSYPNIGTFDKFLSEIINPDFNR